METPSGQRQLLACRYLRVSTGTQRADLQSDETASLIERRGWKLVDTYLDLGVSGRKDHRPELDRMLADARKRKFDCVIVWRSDRLFRSLRHMVNTLDEFAALGIDFVSVTEPFDSSTPQGRLMMQLVSAFSQFEASLVSERTRSGLEAARRRGARIGRRPVTVDLQRAIGLRDSGMSLRQIARDLGIGVATLCRAFQSNKQPFPIEASTDAKPAQEYQVVT